MNKVVVDTDVVSFAFRGDTRALLYAPHLDGKINVISFMTYAELLRGALNRNWGAKRHADLTAFIKSRYVIVHPNRKTCEAWARLIDQAKKSGRILKTADGWIAATAETLGVPLVTNNARDFLYLQGLTVITESNS
ncbi:type II toxin-antitoxin system VapC family toxin [Novipirellula sp.]|uniref:type II toxin-antitoxin system VapC family toxin n=1 Tax=Novipirellula sp. TaxID=2795430 RepID=UPI0030EE1F58|tara:strand:+ start:21358 stop:21765 length:408 start_codon:yes stop_codon:yes gene_type:complete